MRAELSLVQPEIVQSLRKEAGLPLDPSLPPYKTYTNGSFEQSLDPKEEDNHELIRWAIRGKILDIDRRLGLLDSYFSEVFGQKEVVDQTHAGEFLRFACALLKDGNAPQEIKDKLDKLLSGSCLEDILEESAIERWQEEPAEAALHAYCAFNSFEKMFGEKRALEMYKALAENLIFARLYDESLEIAAGQVSRREDGTVIYLGERSVVAQVIAQHAFQMTNLEFDAEAVDAPYYRSQISTTFLEGHFPDPDGNLMTIDEAMADLCRVDGGTRPTGVELPLKGKVNKKGKLTVYYSVANIGGHILPASGYAEALRIQAIRRRGILYDGPRTAVAFRDIQLDCTDASVMIELGDGAYMHLLEALEMQMASRLPVVNLIHNNGVAIGTNQKEVLAQCELWQKGHGKGIPGVRIEKTDPVGLWMAVWFATKRALLDAGPSIVEAMVVRLLPHSVQHGDHITVEYLMKVQSVIEKYSASSQLTRELTLVANTKNQVALKVWLDKTRERVDIDPALRASLRGISEEMIDPFTVCIEDWKKDGAITDSEIQGWTESSRIRVNANLDEVLKRPGPKVENALQFFKMPIVHIPGCSYSREKLSLTGISAINLALEQSLRENPQFLMRGVDIYKGYDFKDGKGVQVGGYYHHEDGLHDLFAHEPGKFHNMPICENTVTAYLMGLSTTLTDEESMKNSFRVLVDFQYADYGIQCKEALHVLGRICYTTGGRATRRLGILLPSGAVAGGGLMHSGEYALEAFASPSSVNVYYASDPETTYKLLRYCTLYENNPYIFMVDKGIMTKTYVREFEIGTGFLEPGRARIVRSGGDTQYIAYGSMVNKIEAALKKTYARDHIGLLDVCSLRPFPFEDIENYLKWGDGPIIIVHEEPRDQSFGSYIVDQLSTNPEFIEVVGRRPIHHIGAKPSPGIPCAGILMKTIIPQVEDFL